MMTHIASHDFGRTRAAKPARALAPTEDECMRLSAACLPRGGWRDCASQEWAGVAYRGGADLRYEIRDQEFDGSTTASASSVSRAIAPHLHSLAAGTMLAILALIQWGITAAARQL